MKIIYSGILISLFLSGCAQKAFENKSDKDHVIDCGSFSIKQVSGVSPTVDLNFYVDACYDGYKMAISRIIINDHTQSILGKRKITSIEYKPDSNGMLRVSLQLGTYSFECKGFGYRGLTTSSSTYQPGKYSIRFSLSNADVLD